MTRDPWLVFKWVLVVVIAILLFVALFADRLFGDVQSEHPIIQQHGTASWYSRESCRQDDAVRVRHKQKPTNGVCADGSKFDETKLTAASWFYPFGTRLRVTHGERSVVVTVTDRGPSKRLVKQGRIIDLSVRAFRRLAPLSAGVITVTVGVVK